MQKAHMSRHEDAPIAIFVLADLHVLSSRTLKSALRQLP